MTDKERLKIITNIACNILDDNYTGSHADLQYVLGLVNVIQKVAIMPDQFLIANNNTIIEAQGDNI